jgi:hypothetical protein
MDEEVMALRKFWGKFKRDTKILKEYIVYTHEEDIYEAAMAAIQEICNKSDRSKPVLLSKHINELTAFNRTVFYTLDFFDETGFDELELEIISSDKLS